MRLLEFEATDLQQHPHALSDVFAARLTGIVIRRVFSRDVMAGVVDRLERGDFGLQSLPSTHFKGETYGQVLIVGENRDLGGYFREAARFRAACAELFSGGPDFQATIEDVVGGVAGGRSVRMAPGPDGTFYSPATIRGLHEGGQIDLHCESETVDFPSMWHLARLLQARNQVSYYVTLSVPEQGGELVIHNARYAEGPGEMLSRMERTGSATIEALAPYGQLVPRLDAGDLLMFDAGRYFHRVTTVVGKRKRWTMGGFMARSLDDRAVHYWS